MLLSNGNDRKTTNMNQEDYPYSGLYLIGIPLLAIIILLNLLPSSVAHSLVKENHAIENATVVGYCIGALIACLFFFRLRWDQGLATSIILVLLGSRELDFHDKFTTMGIFKIKFYLGSEVLLPEKLIGATIVFLLLAFVVWFLKNNTDSFLACLKNRRPCCVTVLAGLVSLPFSKLLDSSIMGLVDNDRLIYFEESVELAIPYFFIVALLQFYFFKKKGEN